MTNERIPAIEGLFSDTADGPRLLGSKCSACGTPYFPRSPVCHNPGCGEPSMEDASFGPTGKLWSYSVQHYPPPPPARYDEPFTPYALGVVDLPEGLRVIGRMSVDDLDGIQMGADVELVLERLYGDEHGKEVITWMFKPV